jgi:hypothetical protein
MLLFIPVTTKSKYFLLNQKGLKTAFSASSSSFIGGEPAPHSGLEHVLQRFYS